MFPSDPFGQSGFSCTCSSLVWKGRSCWGPGIWPARRWAPSGGPRRWPGADWPHIHLQRSNMVTITPFNSYFIVCFLVHSSGQYSANAEPHPSSWGAGRRPACIAPRGRCRARWEPEPETNISLFRPLVHRIANEKLTFQLPPTELFFCFFTIWHTKCEECQLASLTMCILLDLRS